MKHYFVLNLFCSPIQKKDDYDYLLLMNTHARDDPCDICTGEATR